MAKALRPVSDLSRKHPEAEVAAMDAKWHLLSRFDSAVVSLADGSGAAWYKRQPAEFRAQLERSVALRARILREWPELSRRYKDALPDVVGQQAWKATFARTEPDEK
jgi:galactofuranosylgalactofuranosylrhamnosyl-N-acetylglucosaminyl-diphospho-decaprenol beta-1,5/1,6-galactofuranosyltransferase